MGIEQQAEKVEAKAKRTTRKHGEWVVAMARFGYTAKGLLYIAVGAIAARASLGADRPEGARGTASELLQHPVGALIVGLIATGLLGYSAWRLVRAIANPEDDHAGSRIYSVFTAFVHLSLFITVVSAILGRPDNGDGAVAWTARALNSPMGRWIVLSVALGLVMNGLWQIYKAMIGKLDDDLKLFEMSDLVRTITRWGARAGMAARGVVFGLIGVSVAIAALQRDPSEARGLDRMLESILGARYGKWLLTAVAVGFVAYGVYELSRATYRRVRTG